MAQASILVALFYLCFFQLDLLQCYNQKLQKPNISPECESEGICVSVENYPTQLVKVLIDKLKTRNTIFNYDEPQPKIYSLFDDNDEDRFSLSETKPWLNFHKNERNFFNSRNSRKRFRNSYEEPVSLCKTTPQFVSPEGAKDMNGNWQFIINDNEEPVQVFRIEICKTPMGRCSKNIGFMPGYNGKCIQKMVFREMFYVNETNEIGRTYFEVPTCCSCTLFREDDD